MRADAARRLAATSTMLALLAIVGGCATVRPVVRPGPWDRHADSGPLQVFGADRTSPGQQVFQALRREPSLQALLRREGQPDTLAVVGSRYKPKQIVLDYTRPAVGRPHRIVLDPTKNGFVARAPEPLATPSPTSPRRGGRPVRSRKGRTPHPGSTSVRESQPTAEPTPNARQQLECPIDATRSDCQALCKGGASYEWCR